MSKFTLSDLENLTGINSDTIRIWERRYSILSPNRTLTNRKWYNDDDLKKLINISVLYHNGVKISKIAMMTGTEIRERASSVSEGSKTTGDIINSLFIAMNSLDEHAVNEMIMKSVISRGFEKTFTEVLFPFLHKVGIMWHTGAITPSTEHFFSAILRSRLINAIDSLPAGIYSNGKKVVMFLPEGEFHELGLLFYSYIIQKKGHMVLYLGQSTPLDSLEATISNWNPDIIITGIQSGLFTTDPEEYLRKLSAMPGKQKVYAGGGLAFHANQLKLKNVKPLRSDKDLEFL
jgi:MerR family transcriptional regulator, light-induced transcriptional regulator